MLEERKMIGAWERIENHWILLRGADRVDGNFTVRLYSGVELATLLKRAGFSEVAIYGGLAAKPYDQNAERLVAVARK
jgi:hypothetical protein